MSGNIVRYGIVGCAGIALTHAEAVTKADGAELVACADVVEESARELATEYDLEWYSDSTEMITEMDLDAVSICTPSGTHSDIVEDVAATGANVLCEKPLDVTLEKMDRMIAACDDADVALSGVFQRRFHPAARRAKEAIDSGELGHVTLGDTYCKWYRSQGYYDQANWRGTPEMDGGTLMNQAIHGVDMLRWLMGGIESVNAKCGTLARDIDVEDTAVVNLEFENGAYGSIEATTTVYPEKPLTVDVLGTKGSFVLDIDNNDLRDFETVGGAIDFESNVSEFDHGHARQIQDFVDALREGRPPTVDGRGARRSVEAVLAMYESSERNEPIRLDELRSLHSKAHSRDETS